MNASNRVGVANSSAQLIGSAMARSAMGIALFVALLAAFASSCATAQPITKAPAVSWLVNNNMLAPENTASGREIQKMERQLAKYSNKDLTVVVTADRSFEWGQAHGNGAVIFDPREKDGDKNLLAYRLAHEWAHEALGQEPTMFSPDGQSYRFRRSTEAEETTADLYAGGFLAEYGYAIEPVCSTLDGYSSIPWDSRTSGAVRSKRVKDGYVQEMAKINASRKVTAKNQSVKRVSDFGPNGS